MKTKLFTLLFVLLTSVGAIFADGIKIGDLYYNLDDKSKTAEVTYKNYLKKYDQYNRDIHYHKWDITKAVIPASINYKGCNYRVTRIGAHAFHNCESLTSVIIPSSITSVGEEAFYYCSKLRSVYITDLAAWCAIDFSKGKSMPFNYSAGDLYLNNTKVIDLVIPNNVTAIKNDAFNGCRSLKSVTIPNSVTSIGFYAFYNCSSLTSVTIPNSVTSIGGSAFYNCSSLTSVTIPNSVTSIGGRAFYKCSGLTSVTIGNSVTKIGWSAFTDCTGLTSIEIPNSVISIGSSAFEKCSNLTSVAIPNSVTSIGGSAFKQCNKLIVYTASDVAVPNFSPDSVIKVSQNQLLLSFYPFSTYAKEYVEKGVNDWQQKGEFERTADWQKRVNDQTRQQKIKELLAEAEQNYISFHLKSITLNPTLGKYDADNEVFAMTDAKYGTFYMAVPFAEAPNFKKNWDNKKLTFQLQIKDDQFKLALVSITLPDRKEYTYRNTDAVNYNMAEIEYNFAPVDLNFAGSNTPQSRQNITTTKLKAGKSQVDTDIPETGASNPNTFVVIFANEDYKNEASVPFAKNDGAIFQKYCHKTLGIPIDNVHFVENASFNDIRIQLSWLNDICNAFDGNASLIVYYAGHGIPDETSKSSYLLPVDGDGRYMASAYKLDDLYQKLGAMNAKSVTVFMDACFSGSKRENDGMLASARGVALKSIAGQPKGNMVVFSAAQGQETAYPIMDEQHGMFTYYLLKKLQETKGDVTLKDLGDYITTNVRQQSVVKNGKTQTPCVMPASAVADTWQTWMLK